MRGHRNLALVATMGLASLMGSGAAMTPARQQGRTEPQEPKAKAPEPVERDPDAPPPVFSKTDDAIPDYLSGDPRRPGFHPAAHMLGVRIDGVEVNTVTEYDLKGGWYRQRGGGSIRLVPERTFEVFWREKPSRQFLRQLARSRA